MNRRLLLLSLSITASNVARAQQPSPPPQNLREAEVVAFAVAWLAMLEEGDDLKSFDLLAPTFQRNLTRAAWKAALNESKIQLGNQTSQKLRRVVWYENPKNAPLPGTYAACFTHYIPEWNNRNMEPCCKYCYCWNNCLYFYTGSRPVCHYCALIPYSYCTIHHTGFCPGCTYLPGAARTCITYYFIKWY